MNQSFGVYRPPGRIAYLKGPQSSAPKNLLEYISLELPQTPLENLLFFIQLGAVYVNKKRVQEPSFILNSADQIRVHLEPKRYPFNREELLKKIIYEEDNFVVFNKPTGIPMHATLDNAKENLAAAFESKLYVTNRLDVPTSGLVLLAKTKEYQAYYNQLLTDRKVKKTYQAVTLKAPPLGLQRHFMVVSERAPKKILTENEYKNQELQCEECLLEITKSEKYEFDLGKRIKTLAPGFLNEINLITGRTHQIRAQLSKLDCPIVGDEMYGGLISSFFGLHCSGLMFEDHGWDLPFSKR